MATDYEVKSFLVLIELRCKDPTLDYLIDEWKLAFPEEAIPTSAFVNFSSTKWGRKNAKKILRQINKGER